MNLDRSLERARAVRGPKKAAELYNDLEYELALGDYTEEQADEAERALRELEASYPGVRSDARQITKPPARSRSSNRRLDDGEHRGRSHRPRSSSSSSRPNARVRLPAAPTSGTDRARQAARVVRQAAGDASPVSSSDVEDAIIGGLQFLLLAGVVYQVLQPKGAGAFGSILSSIGNGVRRFVAPVDLFGAAPQSQSPPPGIETLSQAPAASVSSPGVVTVPGGPPHAPVAPNKFTDPFAPFPPLQIHNPLLATGPAGSHVKAPTSPLSTGG